MNLSAQKTLHLINELTLLSTDPQLLPFIDHQTSQRIKAILHNNQSISSQQENVNHPRRSITEIDELNQLYHQNFPNLFQNQQDQFYALKEINVQLSNNRNHLNPNSSKTFTKLNHKKSITQLQQENYTGQNSSKGSVMKFHDSSKKNLTSKKKSKQKLISYKVGTGTPKFKKQISQSSQKLLSTKSKQITPQKASTTKLNLHNTLQTKDSMHKMKRSQSHKQKFNPISLNSTAKLQKHSTMKTSQSKGSLLSTNKLKLVQKNQLQDTGKRMLKSFSSVETVLMNGKNGSCQGIVRNPSKSSKEKLFKKKEMLKKISKLNNEYSLQPQTKANAHFFYDTPCEPSHQQKTGAYRRVVTDINDEALFPYSQKQISSQSESEQHHYLREMINDIYSQQEQKIEEKQRLGDVVARLKQQILSQSKRLQQTTSRNNKLRMQQQTLAQFTTYIMQQRTLTQKSIQTTKRKIKSLQQQVTKKQKIYTKVVSEQTPEELQLISMYENVIEEIKKEIKQQGRKKNQVKGNLQKVMKKLESREVKFSNTLMTTQKIKADLGDAFREWV